MAVKTDFQKFLSTYMMFIFYQSYEWNQRECKESSKRMNMVILLDLVTFWF